jgi:hypothetical protein
VPHPSQNRLSGASGAPHPPQTIGLFEEHFPPFSARSTTSSPRYLKGRWCSPSPNGSAPTASTAAPFSAISPAWQWLPVVRGRAHLPRSWAAHETPLNKCQ